MGITEGQWEIHETTKSSCHIYVGSHGNEVVLAAVQNQDFKANAHLIAAAPKTKRQRDELLKACKAAQVMLLQTYWNGDSRMDIVSKAIANAEA